MAYEGDFQSQASFQNLDRMMDMIEVTINTIQQTLTAMNVGGSPTLFEHSQHSNKLPQHNDIPFPRYSGDDDHQGLRQQNSYSNATPRATHVYTSNEEDDHGPIRDRWHQPNYGYQRHKPNVINLTFEFIIPKLFI
ncbi:Uncharacterized protein Adt_32769 [Abeliophyllum distichum]|uniref:Uncharacterized protein n=1 Tax=Abeliophyllum distichum TaxID=126358 RepID=A0ABD1QUG3_9LAMI